MPKWELARYIKVEVARIRGGPDARGWSKSETGMHQNGILEWVRLESAVGVHKLNCCGGAGGLFLCAFTVLKWR